MSDIKKPDYKIITPFKGWVLENFPFIEADFDVVTNYGLISKVIEYLNQVIYNESLTNSKIIELVDAFNNLDINIQEDVNNKLDEMVEDGTLENLLNDKVNLITVYNTYNDMISDDNLVDNLKVKTLGYYSINDGGGCEYYITETQPETGYYISLDSLYLVPIIKDSINVKQLGAKGNGTDDDSDPIDIALRNYSNVYIPNGTYIVTKQLRLFNTRLVGENQEKTIIKFSNFSNEYSIMNNDYWNYPNTQTIYIENLTFIDNKNLTSPASKTIGLANITNSILKNLIFINNDNSVSGCIDLYSNNKNVILDNLKCYATNTTYSNNFIRVREYNSYDESTPNRYTDNIVLTNLYAKMSGVDECIWIDAWKGIVKNVYGNNIHIESTSSTRANLIYAGVNASNCVLDNVLIENSYFKMNTLTSRLLSIGMSQSSVSDSIVKNIKFNNCKFEVDATSTTTDYIIRCYQYLADNGAIIENCSLINNGSKIGYALGCSTFDKVISKNNYFEGVIDYTLLRVNSYYDEFNVTGNATRNVKFIKGATGSCSILINNYQNDVSQYDVEDCNLSLARVISDSGNTVQATYNVLNCNFNISSYFNIITSGSYEPLINIINTNISKIPLSNTKNGIINASGLTVNGVELGSIPSDSVDRYLYNVGQRFISNTATKTIVRKVSSGDSTTNWEEL